MKKRDSGRTGEEARLAQEGRVIRYLIATLFLLMLAGMALVLFAGTIPS